MNETLTAFTLRWGVSARAANRHPTAPGHWRYESAQWLAAHLMTELVELPGGHMAYLADPHAFAAALGPLLRAPPDS